MGTPMCRWIAVILFFASLVSARASDVIFNSIAAMQAASPQSGEVLVLGYSSAGDGGGGHFWFDPASSASSDSGTIFAPTSGSGRWKRVYSGPVNVDWFGANNPGNDVQAAFTAAALFPSVYVPNRTYLMNGSTSILSGQQWKFDGSVITHTDNTKVMFKALSVDGWSFKGPVTLTGTLTTSSNTGEKGLYVEACRRFRVADVTATLFQGPAIHIAPGTRAASSFLADVGQWSNIHVDQSMVGLQGDAGTAAEYQTFSNLTATGNITGVQIAAGNYIINGGSIVKNVTNGLVLLGGSNNGHGIISSVNINHNPAYNIIADGVSNGFTLNGIHAYADSSSTGKIWFKNATTGILIANSIIDSPVVHDVTGTDRIVNSWIGAGTSFSVTGSNTAGLVQSGNF